MHGNVPVRFGRGRLDSLGHRGLAAYLIGNAPLGQAFGEGVDQTLAGAGGIHAT